LNSVFDPKERAKIQFREFSAKYGNERERRKGWVKKI
jgi:hypothetical protein